MEYYEITLATDGIIIWYQPCGAYDQVYRGERRHYQDADGPVYEALEDTTYSSDAYPRHWKLVKKEAAHGPVEGHAWVADGARVVRRDVGRRAARPDRAAHGTGDAARGEVVGTDWITVAGWLTGPVATALIAWLGASLRESRRRSAEHDRRRDAEHAALIAGMRELMRSQLHEMHKRYVVDSVPMPYDEKERADSVYRVYHALGGNGTGTHIHDELMAAYVGVRKEK